MKKVIIYTTATCPYCVMAKNLLEDRGFKFEEVRVDLNEKEREKMMAVSGRRTVPQIFIDEQHIGGYDDLYAYFQKS